MQDVGAGVLSPTCRTRLRPLVTREFVWSIEGLSLERMKACVPGAVLNGPTLQMDGVELYASLFCNGDGAVAETREHACLVRAPVCPPAGACWRILARACA